MLPDAGIKSGTILPKSFPKVAKAVFLIKSDIFHYSPNVGKDLGYCCTILCCQDRSKVAQSGHTGSGLKYLSVGSFRGP